MPTKLFGLLLDVRLHLAGIIAVVATWGTMESYSSRALARGLSWDITSSPLVVEEDHDGGGCLLCRRLGSEAHAATRVIDLDGPGHP